MFWISPSGAVSRDVAFGALIERHRFGALSISCFDRVFSLLAQLPALGSSVPGFSEANGTERTETHVTFFSGHSRVAENPAFRTAVAVSGSDLKIETAAIRIELNAGGAVRAPSRFCVLHFDR